MSSLWSIACGSGTCVSLLHIPSSFPHLIMILLQDMKYVCACTYRCGCGKSYERLVDLGEHQQNCEMGEDADDICKSIGIKSLEDIESNDMFSKKDFVMDNPEVVAFESTWGVCNFEVALFRVRISPVLLALSWLWTSYFSLFRFPMEMPPVLCEQPPTVPRLYLIICFLGYRVFEIQGSQISRNIPL